MDGWISLSAFHVPIQQPGMGTTFVNDDCIWRYDKIILWSLALLRVFKTSRVHVVWCWAVTEFTDTGLLPFTWYEYRVSSNNGFGAALSPGVLYRTGADVPSGNFTASVELTQTTSVSLSWSAPSSPNGVIQRYDLTSYDRSADTTAQVKHAVKRYSSPEQVISELRGVMGSHSITCHPTQVNAPHLSPARQAGARFTYPRGMEG